MWPPRVRGWRSCRSNSNLAVFGEFSLKFSTQLSPASPPWVEGRGFIEFGKIKKQQTEKQKMKTNKLFLVMAVVMLSALLSGCTVYTSGWSYHQVEPVYVPAPVEVYYSYPSYSAGFEYRSGRIVRHRTWGPTPRQHGPPPSPRHQSPPRQAPPRHR